jgi:outer membrane protein assembly factor BamB
MNLKRFSFVFAGCLLIGALTLLGLSWYQSASNGETIGEWWTDLGLVRNVNDLTTVLTGETTRQRQEYRVAHELKSNLPALRLANHGAPPQQPKAPDKTAPWPMFGGTPSRNMVNVTDKNIPTTWNVEDGKRKNIKWVADLGSYSYSGPIIADGKVFVGTNNYNRRDAKIKDKDKAVLMAFNEADGKFLWQLVHEMSDASPYRDFGLVSTPAVEGKRIFYITPGCIVVCANTAGEVQWTYDMMKELKVFPHHCAGSSPLVVGDLVMIVTGNGVDEEGKLVSPKAPSFIALNKNTGKIAWQSNLPGENIIEGQWSNPTLVTVNGNRQVIFPGGDCVLYSFEPETGNLIWKCDCNPTRKKKGDADRKIDNYIVATPVVVGDKLYIGLGPMPEHDQRQRVSYFLCLDITKRGDVSLKSYDVKDAANRKSALVWVFGGPIQPPPPKGRLVYTGTICATAAIHDGLVYIAEESGYLHCLDAKTGQSYWNHDFKDGMWGSAYFVDGKVYIGTESGDIVIFEHGKKLKILATNSMDEALKGTPVVANGVLYVTTKTKLYAIATGK